MGHLLFGAATNDFDLLPLNHRSLISSIYFGSKKGKKKTEKEKTVTHDLMFFLSSLSLSPSLTPPMNGFRLGKKTLHEREMSHADALPIHVNPEGGDKQFSERRRRWGKPNNATARQKGI